MFAEEFGISKGTDYGILTNKVKVCAQFVSHMVTEDQEKVCVEHCKDLIKAIKRMSRFLDSIVTID